MDEQGTNIYCTGIYWTNLKVVWTTSSHDFYKYLQFIHYLRKHNEWKNICKTISELEELFDAIYKKNEKEGYIKNL